MHVARLTSHVARRTSDVERWESYSTDDPAPERLDAYRVARELYAMARGSATECAAILDMAGLRGLVPALDGRRGRGLLVRLVQMLTRLQASCRQPER